MKTMMLKVCTKCGVKKKLGEFCKQSSKKDGLYPHCKECLSKKNKEYRTEHKEETKIKQKEYDKANKEKIKIYQKKYRDENKKDIKTDKAEYQKEHREEIKIKNKKYQKIRRQNDIGYRLKGNLSSRLRQALKRTKKKDRTVKYLGCTIEFFKQFLESQFTEGMSWSNYGNIKESWSIDHILPCSSFDHSDDEQVKKCWHYSNMQPMWHLDNIKKGNRRP